MPGYEGYEGLEVFDKNARCVMRACCRISTRSLKVCITILEDHSGYYIWNIDWCGSGKGRGGSREEAGKPVRRTRIVKIPVTNECGKK